MPTNRVFSAPKEIGQPPDTTEMVYPKWLEAEGKYVAKVVEYAKKKVEDLVAEADGGDESVVMVE